jgi:hypothetical protein
MTLDEVVTIAKLRGSLKKPSLAESLIQGRCGAWNWRRCTRL